MKEKGNGGIDLGAMLRCMSEPMRFRIVNLLLQRAHCARSLSQTLGISEPAVSQHMTALREAGLVRAIRHGHHFHYQLVREAVESIVETMQLWLSKMDSINGDCHNNDPCRFKIGDDTVVCMYGKLSEKRGN